MLHGEYLMTGSGPAVISHSLIASTVPESEEIESRFGRVTIYPRQQIIFPNGMLGMPDKARFCLSHFPSEKMARFKLLQSIDDLSLSFITLPVDITNPIIEREDLEQAARDLEMPIDDLAVLLIVTVHRESGVAKLTVNGRAPVLMHIERRVAAQYVFPNTKYLIRQPLSM
jgi:flagellar assembly factor FliW